jgi:hypothetical protein
LAPSLLLLRVCSHRNRSGNYGVGYPGVRIVMIFCFFISRAFFLYSCTWVSQGNNETDASSSSRSHSKGWWVCARYDKWLWIDTLWGVRVSN